MGKLGAIHHISLSVSDYEQSKKFYTLLLVDFFGYKKVMDEPYCTMWMSGDGEGFCISPGNQNAHHKTNPGLHHVAFNAESNAQIDAFYNKVVDFQAKNVNAKSVILDKPAEYPEYGPGYYAVFFTDPDGIKLEIAYTPTYH
ncbi:hypothetical protein BGZ83_009139 [Gryganskiella cystojenkinii]|nr:hypothetical protein BGZ83_009139 [Gryganskiella cystojenkinii]